MFRPQRFSIPKCLTSNPSACFRAIARRRRHSFAIYASFRNHNSRFPNFLAFNGSHVLRSPSRRPPSPHPAVRGAKTRTTVRVEDLAQGVIPLDPFPLEDGAPSYPTVVLQARTNMRRFENCVLLTRVGGFYELYFEQAEEFGPLLNLKVAQKRTNAGPVSMVGVSRIRTLT
jgi:hypothetical protein